MLRKPYNKNELETINKKGEVVGYIIDKEQMEKLEEFIEDMIDTIELKNAMEDNGDFGTLEDLKDALKKEGKI